MKKPTTSRMSWKKYKCRECGHETTHSTNHYGATYSLGNYHACPICPPWKRPTTWDCCEPCPDNMEKPEEWKTVKLGDICTIQKGAPLPR